MNSSRRRGLAGRTVALLATAAATAALLAAAGPAAHATPPPNPSDPQLNGARAAKTALADRVGRLSAQVADMQNEVQLRRAAAELAEQKFADARQKLQAARAAVTASEKRRAAAQIQVDKATKLFGAFVRASYMDSPISSPAAGLLTAQDPNGLLTRSDYVRYSAAHKLDVIDGLTRAKVAQANANAAARAARDRQAAATAQAQQAQRDAEAALRSAQAASAELGSKLAATQAALGAARLQLATLNNQRAAYVAWQKEQARVAAARAAAEARARAAAAAAAAANSDGWHPAPAPPPAPSGGSWSPGAGQAAADRAMRYLGIQYAFAGGGFGGPTYGVCVDGDAWNDCHVFGFDCSGLALYAWAPYLQMDHYAATQYSQAGSYHPDSSALMPGDLVFWSYDGTRAGIHHVAIYVGGGSVVQAPQSGDIVRVTPLWAVDSGYFGATRPLT